MGPTLDYFGKEIESFAKKRAENIGRIFQKAIKKLGSKIDEPGQVHPKMLKVLILDGSFCDDDLTAEYYGGILASSRIGISRDDRGASFLEQVSHLSFYQGSFNIQAPCRAFFSDAIFWVSCREFPGH